MCPHSLVSTVNSLTELGINKTKPSLPPVLHQVIRNFELMGRVSLDQLEMMKEHGSGAEEEEEQELMGMDGKMPAEDEDEGMEIMENEAEEQRAMDDEELEEVFKEEEGEEEDEEDGGEEREAEKPAPQGKSR